MPNPSWPVSLVTAVRIGWQGVPLEMSKMSQMSRPNVMKKKQIASRCILQYDAQILLLTKDDYETLRDFWATDCAGGSLPFDWKYPHDGSQSASFYWVSPPQFLNVHQGGLYRCSLQLRDA